MILLINMRIKILSRTKGKYTGLYKKNKISGARGETRTRTGISPLDPKSSASTISATLAHGKLNNLIRVKVEVKKSSVNTVKKGTTIFALRQFFYYRTGALSIIGKGTGIN